MESEEGRDKGKIAIRRLALTERGVQAGCALMACGIDSPDKLLIPSPRGTGWNPNNFNETWRAVRGTAYADLTPTQIRHRVGTDVREGSNIIDAARQLGNSEVVAAKHYAKRNREVDNRAALERKSA
ncbi:hypothetical protein [Nocardia sp. NPDC051570]|uniref:hypothetical protein n=1 Tax=Nocardia sp. NPDC051570 TaxID=3364324 RepID=UPI0037A3B82A